MALSTSSLGDGWDETVMFSLSEQRLHPRGQVKRLRDFNLESSMVGFVCNKEHPGTWKQGVLKAGLDYMPGASVKVIAMS